MDGDSRQNPAYRATLLSIRWAQVETALTFLRIRCTSCYITCRRFECFYGEIMGKCGQFYGQILTSNNFLVFSIVDDNSLKGAKAHAYLQFNR